MKIAAVVAASYALVMPQTASAAPASAAPARVESSTPLVAETKGQAFKTSTALNIRKGAGTSHKRIKTLGKGTKVVEISQKSGWKKVKAGKTTGWVSARYLKLEKPAKKASQKLPGKVTPYKKPSGKKLHISQVHNIAQARTYIKQHCPRVSVGSKGGITSTYHPTGNKILMGSSTSKSRFNYSFSHELGHHYQWSQMKGSVSQWNKKIRNGSLEVEADRITQVLTGKSGDGFYTKKKNSSSQRNAANQTISLGKSRGC